MGIYNCANTLPAAIDSIIAQTYTNWELIMCDDCSTDDTYKVAEKYKNKYPEKIILIRNNANSSLAFSLNHCLKYADGEFIARMDGDDISSPERFEKQIAFLKQNPNFDLVGTSMQRFDNDKFVDIVRLPERPNKFILKETSPFCHATIIARRSVFDDLNGYTVSKYTRRCEDLDLWFRFYHKGFIGANIDESLYYVRENLNAIKRRTFKSRMYSTKIRLSGFKMLDFPKSWSVQIIMKDLFKSLVPYRIIAIYRKWQARKKGE